MNPDAGVLPAFLGPDAPVGLTAFFTTRWTPDGKTDFRLGSPKSDDSGVVEAHWQDLRARYAWQDRRIFRPRQMHGHAVWKDEGENEDNSGLSPALDAGVSNRRDIVLTALGADCLTALLVDPKLGGIGAVHAGWKGTRDGVLGRTIDALFAAGWAQPESLRVAFGPCLSPPAFEIGPEVAEQLPPEFVHRQSGRLTFDMPGCNRRQAVDRGIPPARVTWQGRCTLSEPQAFYSHRRERDQAGRQAACIAWNAA